jgi:terminase large subunit-like protein
VIVEPDHLELADLLVSLHVDTLGADSWERIKSDLHPKQRAFVEDRSNRKVALKGRRGGGSWGVAAWLLEDWHLWGGHLSLFIARTRDHAKSILWPTLERMDALYGLGITFNSMDLSAVLPNGYKILLRGAKDRSQIEKLRGFAQGLRRCVIDEAGSFADHDDQFRYLLHSIIVPQFTDTIHLGGGQLALVGSPGLDPIGLYFEVSTGHDHRGKPVPQWSTHHWTALDNSYLDGAAAMVEDLRGGTHILDDSTPEAIVDELIALKDVPPSNDNGRWDAVRAKLSAPFRREQLAQWTRDNESRVYSAADRNFLPAGYELDPHRVWRIIVGADIGWNDGNGFAVAAKCLEGPEVVLLEAYRIDELGTEGIARELIRLSRFWRASEIYVDTGGVGDMRLEDLANFGCYARRAIKGGRKKPRIEYMRALLENGNLKIVRDKCTDLLTEWITLSWSPDRQNHREGVPDDVSDGTLYAVFPLSQLFVAPDERPRPGTPEWVKAQDDREREAATRAGRRLKRLKRHVS